MQPAVNCITESETNSKCVRYTDQLIQYDIIIIRYLMLSRINSLKLIVRLRVMTY